MFGITCYPLCRYTYMPHYLYISVHLSHSRRVSSLVTSFACAQIQCSDGDLNCQAVVWDIVNKLWFLKSYFKEDYTVRMETVDWATTYIFFKIILLIIIVSNNYFQDIADGKVESESVDFSWATAKVGGRCRRYSHKIQTVRKHNP